MADAGEKKKEHQGKGGGEGKPKGGAKKGKAAASGEHDAGPRTPPRLKVLYDTEVRKKVGEQFGVKNPMAQPKLEKIVLNVNMGRHLDGTKIPPHVRQTIIDTLGTITGQKPVVVKAKKSVANFKLRAGFESSVMVTLRRDRMWHFLDRFIHLATPRIKDFRGLSDKAFDRQGNYSVGINEQGVFPEINMAEVEFTHGMNINFCFARSNPASTRFVLDALGMPFVKPEEGKQRSPKAEKK